MGRNGLRPGQGPPSPTPTSLTVAGIDFADHEYDDRGDVLYLSVEGYDAGGLPSRAYACPEGHGIEWDEHGRVIAMTLVNVRWLIDRDAELRITWPDGHVSHDDRAAVFAAAP
jgi:uncharacterized protein YuzE